MVADLKTWVRQLVLIVILVGVVEMLLPDASMRKYARATLGLLVLIAILVPFLGLLHREVRWAEAFSALPAQGYAGPAAAGESLKRVERELMLSVFRDQVAERAKRVAEGIPGVGAAGARVEVESSWGSPRFGTVRRVELMIGPAADNLREEVAQAVARDLGLARGLVKVQVEVEGRASP